MLSPCVFFKIPRRLTAGEQEFFNTNRFTRQRQNLSQFPSILYEVQHRACTATSTTYLPDLYDCVSYGTSYLSGRPMIDRSIFHSHKNHRKRSYAHRLTNITLLTRIATLLFQGESPTYILNEDTQPVIRAIGVSQTTCAEMSCDKIFNLTAGWSGFTFRCFYNVPVFCTIRQR